MAAVLPFGLTSELSTASTRLADAAVAAAGANSPDISEPQDTVTLHPAGGLPTAAEEAGLFQLHQLPQAGTATPVPVLGQADNARPVDPPVPVALGTAAAGANARQLEQPPAAAKPAGAKPAVPPSQALPAQKSPQLNALDDALRAEGLTESEIRQVNQLAAFLGVYNPVAYISLVRQIEQQARAESPQNTVNAPQSQTNSTSAPAKGLGAQSSAAGAGNATPS